MDGPLAADVSGFMQIQAANTSREALRAALRDSIRCGQLPPGIRLKRANDIAHAVGFSRSTVGAALFDLVHEGFLTSIAGGGKIVAKRIEVMLRVHIIPNTDVLTSAFSEYEAVLGFLSDSVTSERIWRQLLDGRIVAEVRVRSDPRCWIPPSTWSWSAAIGPKKAQAVKISIHRSLSKGRRWLHVTLKHVTEHGDVDVSIKLEHGLFFVRLN